MTTSPGDNVGASCVSTHRSKAGPVQGLIDDPRRAERVASQAGNEGLREPVAEGRGAGQPSAAPGAAAQPDHLSGDSGPVDEHQSRRLVTHPLLPQDPAAACASHVGAFALRRHQGFFVREPAPAQPARQLGGCRLNPVRRQQPAAQFRHGTDNAAHCREVSGLASTAPIRNAA